MFIDELKPRNCSFRKCRKVFQPKTSWQNYCSPLHRETEKRMRRRELLRKAQRIINAQEKERKAGAV